MFLNRQQVCGGILHVLCKPYNDVKPAEVETLGNGITCFGLVSTGLLQYSVPSHPSLFKHIEAKATGIL